MINIEFFGNYRLSFGISELQLEAKTIKEMLNYISERFPSMSKNEISNATIFVNDKAVQGVFRNRYKFNDGDKVLMLYPSCGG